MIWHTIARSAVPSIGAAAMRRADQLARERFGIEPLQLMEVAGLQVARLADAWLDGATRKRVTVVCGSGNNGGDGMVAARHLGQRFADVRVVALPPKAGPGLAAHQLATTQALQLHLQVVARAGPPKVLEISGDLIIDALLGTGIRLPVEGIQAQIIQAINAAGAPIIAVDIPSGLDADTGGGQDACVQATATLSLGLPKPGVIDAGAAGRLFLADIGLPPAVFEGHVEAVQSAYAQGDLLELR